MTVTNTAIASGSHAAAIEHTVSKAIARRGFLVPAGSGAGFAVFAGREATSRGRAT
jgi:hypothetical protein